MPHLIKHRKNNPRRVDSRFLMNNIVESADPVRVNGFLAAFPDGGFGTAEFFTATRCPVGFAPHNMTQRAVLIAIPILSYTY